ncbi:hypothetical protein D1781_14615 [Amnibacterium setariae]|uniref:Uncharacterized protein n=1 Tax=Amnibacterium setariae TaxID=2306585 RepID=A0A3A1U126_9MICO|nr:hypothetical protein D1781_14615 [Amnibacterium setariae]
MALAVLVATVAGPLGSTRDHPATPPTPAATRPADARVVPVASDARHLVYGRQASVEDPTPQRQERDLLLATDASGRVTPLPGFRGDRSSGFSLVGDSLVETAGWTRWTERRVRYRNLSTGATARVALKTTDSLASAAPDGWVVRRIGQPRPDAESSLVRVRLDGSEVELGVPFPDAIAGGVGYEIQVGDSGVIAYPKQIDDLCASSEVKFQSWSDGGTWRTVFVGAPRSCISCAAAAANSVACRVLQPDEGLVTIPLRGGSPRFVTDDQPERCQTVDFASWDDGLVAIETSDEGPCTEGLVYRFGQDGEVAISTTRYGTSGSVRIGLGRIIVTDGRQHAVFGLDGATLDPRTLVRA